MGLRYDTARLIVWLDTGHANPAEEPLMQVAQPPIAEPTADTTARGLPVSSLPVARIALVALLLIAAACEGAPEPAEPEAPEILILGTEHLAQAETPRPDSGVAEVVDSLRPYSPDMVVVEYLPADWPIGEGRDYRWEFDDSVYARAWDVPLDSAADRLAAAQAELGDVAYDEIPEPRRCELARLHFLSRDRANALYYWTDAGCPAESDSLLTEWIAHRGGHEMVRVAFPLARAAGLRGVVSFDYQGDDARWFLGPELFDEVREEGTEAQVRRLDTLMAAVEDFRTRAAESETGSYMAASRFKNSAEWLEAQRRLYEDVMPTLTYGDSAGRRQTDHYWLRNERMFDRIDAAAAGRIPERVLVVVGAGHKYFLDELAVRRGYEWTDPLTYLGHRGD